MTPRPLLPPAGAGQARHPVIHALQRALHRHRGASDRPAGGVLPVWGECMLLRSADIWLLGLVLWPRGL